MSARSANLAFHFNSRPSARGDSKVTALYNKREVFQFTPLREGRPCRTRHPRLVSISIHAPPRGATQFQQFKATFQGISIHAPPRGATRWLYTQPSFSRHFNSRPSARGDMVAGDFADMVTISIHAPPRGATKIVETDCMLPIISIHAPPRGATTLLVCNRITVEISIHAPPRGATRQKSATV